MGKNSGTLLADPHPHQRITTTFFPIGRRRPHRDRPSISACIHHLTRCPRPPPPPPTALPVVSLPRYNVGPPTIDDAAAADNNNNAEHDQAAAAPVCCEGLRAVFMSARGRHVSEIFFSQTHTHCRRRSGCRSCRRSFSVRR